ncbi:MAG: capsular biosynthesis protein CpsI, partial [Gammaproteobacteria bacterium]
GLIRVLDIPATPNPKWDGVRPDPGSSRAPWRVYNIGNNCSENLLDYIAAFERALGIQAKKELLPMQPGDVHETWADVSDLEALVNYRPNTPIAVGVQRFVDWYLDFYQVTQNETPMNH